MCVQCGLVCHPDFLGRGLADLSLHLLDVGSDGGIALGQLGQLALALLDQQRDLAHGALGFLQLRLDVQTFLRTSFLVLLGHSALLLGLLIRAVQLHPSVLQGVDHRLGAVFHTEFSQDGGNVILYGLMADS